MLYAFPKGSRGARGKKKKSPAAAAAAERPWRPEVDGAARGVGGACTAPRTVRDGGVEDQSAGAQRRVEFSLLFLRCERNRRSFHASLIKTKPFERDFTLIPLHMLTPSSGSCSGSNFC
uniref:uncharacterized protein LOC143405760 n=1 Tax=Callospermophilus lateralis TaxID=76772 RepID=UPI004038A407